MARLSLYEILKKKGTLDEIVTKLKQGPITIEKVQEILSCSPGAAANFLDATGLLEKGPQKGSVQTKATSPFAQWVVCAGPLRGVYTRPMPDGEPVEYIGVTLFLGVVSANNEREAISEIRNKLQGPDAKLLSVIVDESLHAWKISS